MVRRTTTEGVPIQGPNEEDGTPPKPQEEK
jgi:hypothetical protein